MKPYIALFIILMTVSADYLLADIYVVVNKENTIELLDKKEVVDLYMGRTAFFKTGSRVLAVDVALGSRIRSDFYRELIHKSVAEVQAYWARLLFTGRATPPFQIETDAEVIEFVKDNASAIGYVSESALDDGVKVVYVIRN